MLQVPTVHRSPTFTRKQIAEMARGGTLKVRDKSSRPDPVIRHVQAFKRRMEQYNAARDALAEVERLLEPFEAVGDPMLRVEAGYAPALLTATTYFRSLEQVEDVARQRKLHLRVEIAGHRKLLKSKRCVFRLEVQQRLGAFQKHLAVLPLQVAQVRKDFAREWKRVRTLHRQHRYESLRTGSKLAHEAMWRAFDKVAAAETLTNRGAAALTEACLLILDHGAIWPGEAKPLHFKLKAFLERQAGEDR